MQQQSLACDEVRQIGIDVLHQVLHALNKEHGVIITIEHPLVGIAQRLHAVRTMLELAEALSPDCMRYGSTTKVLAKHGFKVLRNLIVPC